MEKVIIEVRGPCDSRKQALQGLLENAVYDDLKGVLRDLNIHTLIRIAQCVHGVMYEIAKRR